MVANTKAENKYDAMCAYPKQVTIIWLSRLRNPTHNVLTLVAEITSEVTNP